MTALILSALIGGNWAMGPLEQRVTDLEARVAALEARGLSTRTADCDCKDCDCDPCECKADVVIYSPTTWHCASCIRAQGWLEARGKRVKVVHTDEFESYPVIDVGNKRLVGFSQSQLSSALGLATEPAVRTVRYTTEPQFYYQGNYSGGRVFMGSCSSGSCR